MSDHLLHITPDQEGYCCWEMVCRHPVGDPRFLSSGENDGVTCNLKVWFDEVGQELIGRGNWPTLVVPVRGDWGTGEDGPIIYPEENQ